MKYISVIETYIETHMLGKTKIYEESKIHKTH